MTDERRILVSVFMERLFSSGSTRKNAHQLYFHKSLLFLFEYLDTADTLNRRSYESFIKHKSAVLNAEYPKYKNQIKSCIRDFLETNKLAKWSKHQVKERPGKVAQTIGDRQNGYLNEFSLWLQQHYDYSPHTLSVYLNTMKGFFRYYQKFSEANARDYLGMLERNGFKVATLQIRRTALMIYGRSVKMMVNIKPIKSATRLSTENVPTEKEYIRLLDYLRENSPVNYLRVKILATTGARHGEMMQMTWEAIASGEMNIKGKGSKVRRFFFTRELISEVKKYMEETGATGSVEKNHLTGLCRSDRCLNSDMKLWADKLGIDPAKLHCHAFRHFFAKMYLKNNKDVVQLAELLGHHSVDITRLYLQKTEDEQKREFNRVVSW